MSRIPSLILALVSLVLPGVGHALARAPGRALLIAVIALPVNFVFMSLQATSTVTQPVLLFAMAWVGLVVCAVAWVAVDTWRRARAAPRGGWARRIVTSVVVVALTIGVLLVPGDPVSWRSFWVPSSSMLPTLHVGDRMIVQDGWYQRNPVRRGDVVVFELPPEGTAYVKRVIGLPGDRVQMREGRLVINGDQVPVDRADGAAAAGKPMREIWHLPDGPDVVVQRMPGGGPGAHTRVFEVPEEHVFVMGDNVENSADSRIDPKLTAVPVRTLVGRAAIIYWPFADGRFGQVIR